VRSGNFQRQERDKHSNAPELFGEINRSPDPSVFFQQKRMNFYANASKLQEKPNSPAMKKSCLQLCLSVAIFSVFLSMVATAEDEQTEYPFGIPTDQPGILISPFPPGRKLDVTGLKPGSLAMDPSVEKVFRIPLTTPKTKGNVGKPPEKAEDYTGKVTKKTRSSDSASPRADQPAKPQKRVMPTTQPSSPSQSTEPTNKSYGNNRDADKMERPRDPGIGGPLPPAQPTTQRDANSAQDTPQSLPEDLVEFVDFFNQSSGNNSPEALLRYYAADVFYFGKRNQSHSDILKDRTAYIRKYPYRRYRMTGQPLVLSVRSAVYELVVELSYTVQGMGRPISGKVADYLVVQKAPQGYQIVGIDETHSGAKAPEKLNQFARQFQEKSTSPTQLMTQRSPSFSGDMDDQIEQFVAAFIKSSEVNDPAASLRYIDPEVIVFYDLKHPSREKLLEDRKAYIKKWPRRHYVLTDEPEIELIGDRIYEVKYELGYEVRSNSHTIGGKESAVMQVAETEQGLKIILLVKE